MSKKEYKSVRFSLDVVKLFELNCSKKSTAEFAFLAFFEMKYPMPFWKNYVVSTFVEIIRWWINNGMQESPETLTDYFLKVV